MEEILLNYEGIIGAVSGAVLATVATLITTHMLKNSGKIEATVFDTCFNLVERSKFNSSNTAQLDFKLKFYNSSESIKYIDDLELICLDEYEKVIYKKRPYNLETLQLSQHSMSVEDLYFVNLPAKQLTLSKLRMSINDDNIERLNRIRVIKLNYVNKKKKNSLIVYKK
ncbi:hypothetical protein ACW0TQ_08095 [Oceanobacillus sp. M60]